MMRTQALSMLTENRESNSPTTSTSPTISNPTSNYCTKCSVYQAKLDERDNLIKSLEEEKNKHVVENEELKKKVESLSNTYGNLIF